MAKEATFVQPEFMGASGCTTRAASAFSKTNCTTSGVGIGCGTPPESAAVHPRLAIEETSQVPLLILVDLPDELYLLAVAPPLPLAELFLGLTLPRRWPGGGLLAEGGVGGVALALERRTDVHSS